MDTHKAASAIKREAVAKFIHKHFTEDWANRIVAEIDDYAASAWAEGYFEGFQKHADWNKSDKTGERR